MKSLAGIFFILLLSLCTSAQDFSAYRKEVLSVKGMELPYRLLSPADDTNKKHPLIIFLHGAFEKENNN